MNMQSTPAEGPSANIGMDLHCVDGGFQGIRSYVVNLFPHVIRQCPELRFFLFLDDVARLLRESPDFDQPNVELVRMRGSHPAQRLLRQLPALERRCNLQALHTQFIAPPLGRSAQVVSLHDVLFESHPRFFKPTFRWRSKLLMRFSASRAAHVFTLSEFSRGEIIQRYGVESERVSIVACAADTARFRPGPDGVELLRRFRLAPRGYLLTVGRVEPRKNHVALVEAYAQLKTPVPPLAIVGPRDHASAELQRRVERLGLKERVLFIDDADERELPVLLRHARLFVYPSWAEGFGIPPLEAMASGVPVITSNTTAMPEVVGSAARTIDPGDTAELAASMRELLVDEELRQRLSEAGLARAEHFRWEREAEKVAAVYRRLVSGAADVASCRAA